MYLENEILIVVEPIGKEEDGNLIPVGTKVEFVKVVDTNDITKSLVAFKHEDKVLVTLETNVKIKSWWRRRKAFKQFNNQMMVNNPRLRRYHPNILLKLYFRVHYFMVDKFGDNNE